MKKYLPVIAVVVLIAAGAGLLLTRDNKKSADHNQTSSSTQEGMPAESSQNSNSSQNSKEAVATNAVTVQDFAFSPATITVKAGTTVTWTNQDSVAHTVTSDSGNLLDSQLLANGETFSFIFNDPGTYAYHCTPHPQMKGTVTVTE